MITIRLAEDRDIAPLVILIQALANDQGFEHYVAVDGDRLRQLMLGDDPLLTILVAEASGGALIGYVSFFLGYSTFSGGPYGTVDNLFVVPDHRGNGTGKELMLALDRRLKRRGIDRIDLSIVTDNDRAREFYQQLGFVVADERLMQWRRPES